MCIFAQLTSRFRQCMQRSAILLDFTYNQGFGFAELIDDGFCTCRTLKQFRGLTFLCLSKSYTSLAPFRHKHRVLSWTTIVTRCTFRVLVKVRRLGSPDLCCSGTVAGKPVVKPRTAGTSFMQVSDDNKLHTGSDKAGPIGVRFSS